MDDQRDTIAFLASGRAFGPDAAIERIDTHAAIIFLTGDRAYKLKRAVRYSFLDFSTVDQRHRVLDAEYRLNRRTAPDLYRRLVPITRDDAGDLALDGAGDVVDWLLEMGRFPQSALFDHLAENGHLDAPLMRSLANEIAELHRAAPVRPGGGHAVMAGIIEGNAGDLASLADDIGDMTPATAPLAATDGELARQRERLDRRAGSGFVRHCHGDLHLGNIYLDDGRPVLFDCLEFDEDLATVDVIYDLAFVLMDLCHRELDTLALDLANAYLDRTEDDDGMALLPLFLAVRATIRAKVEGFEIATAPAADDRARHRRAVREYLDLTGDLLATAPPRLIAIGGRSGTGKSTVARLLAHRLGRRHWPFLLRSDVVRKRLAGVESTTRLGDAGYSAARSTDTYRRLGERAGTLLDGGRTVIVDATFLDPEARAQIEAVAAAREMPFSGVWLDAPRDVLEGRIRGRRGDASDADVSILARQLARDVGPMDWVEVDASDDAARVAANAHARIAD